MFIVELDYKIAHLFVCLYALLMLLNVNKQIVSRDRYDRCIRRSKGAFAMRFSQIGVWGVANDMQVEWVRVHIIIQDCSFRSGFVFSIDNRARTGRIFFFFEITKLWTLDYCFLILVKIQLNHVLQHPITNGKEKRISFCWKFLKR